MPGNKFRIEYLPSVVEIDIPALPSSAKKRIAKAIEERLITEPQLYGKPLRFNYSGLRRLRVGDYRVIYKIEPEKCIVTITAIGHRKDIYEG